MSNARKAQEALEVATVRIGKMIYLPSVLANYDTPGDTFREFVEYDMPEREDAPLYASLPQLKIFGSDDGPTPDIEEVTYRLAGAIGFLVQAETPVKSFSDRHDGFSYSWGHYHCEWLHAPDEASIASVCAAWAEACDAEDRAKQKAA